ncbi:MAG: alkaline phosphatase family protein [Christensenellaceae bacterium]|nr:alkaline phosphatase family protein [Christensenellaceae bacterium]
MRKMVLISLDAVFRDDLERLEPGGFLDSLLRRSTVCDQVKTVFPALTYPAHTTLVTGCDPIDHGIGQNQPFQPDQEPSMRAWYWDAAAVKCPSLFDAVSQAGGKCASVLWPVTGKSRSIRWNFPEVLALPGENQVLKMLSYGTPVWILSTELRLGRQRVSTKEPHLSDYGCLLTCDVIRHKRPDLTALHMVDVDDMRHHHGVASEEALQGLKRLEQRVQRIYETVQSTPGMEDTLFVLVSDHGQADVDRLVCVTEELEKAGFGDVLRVQSNGMTAYLYEGCEDIHKMSTACSYLENNGISIGIERLHSAQTLERMGCFKGDGGRIFAAVEAAPGVVFSDALPEAKREKATHGFGPGHPAEDCLLAIHGRGIPEGMALPPMPMRDAAPTLAELMGVSLPKATGSSHAPLMSKWVSSVEKMSKMRD